MGSTMRAHDRPRWREVVLLVLASVSVAGCDVEEELQLTSDGSGTYRGQVTVGNAFAGVLGRIEQQASRRGFDILEETDGPTGRAVVVGWRGTAPVAGS